MEMRVYDGLNYD